MSQAKRYFVGVGVRTYDHFQELPKAIDDVEQLRAHLASPLGFQTVVIPDPKKSAAREALEKHLPLNGPLAGCALVVLWSGHAEIATGNTLQLVACDTQPGAAKDLSPEWIAELAAKTGASRILFLLDTCYSGLALVKAQEIVDHVQRARAEGSPWFGVLASALAFERARDGVFMQRLLQLLQNGPTTPEGRRRWSIRSDAVYATDVMHVLLLEWPRDEVDQQPRTARIGEELVPMFPNPRFRADAPHDVVEHLLLAADGRSPDEEGVYFTGRKAELAQVVAWVQSRKPGVRVITGPPGSGKSAIAGRVVALSNPEQRHRILELGSLNHDDPGANSVHANVHLRGLTVEQVVERLDQQLVRTEILAPLENGARRNRGELLGGLERLAGATVPVIVLDGLDEARSNAWDIASDVLALLERFACLVVTTRQVARDSGTTLLQALAARATLDLGDAMHAKSAAADLRAYVQARLATIPAVRTDAGAVVDAVLALTAQEAGKQTGGGFLLARILTSQLRADPVDISVPGWQATLSRSLEHAFQRDIDRASEPARAHDLLTALAWSYGAGVPNDVWAVFATAISKQRRRYEVADIDAVAKELGRYIIEDGDGQRAVYRLSHQRLVEVLRPPRSAREFEQRQTEAMPVATALVERYEAMLQSGMEPRAHRYLWQYTWQHCTDAGIQGVSTLRRLVTLRPGDFGLDLAGALTNLGNRYAEVGRRSDALAPTEEAVALYRALAADNPAFVPGLAMALNNLGVHYAEVGRRRDALAPAEEAVALRRVLAADNPAFVPDLAMALNNLGICYAGLGRRRDALAPTEEAVALRRVLAADNPAFVPGLAGALNNLGVHYAEVGRRRDALAPTEEAVALRRVLAADNPAFVPDLASALNNLGVRYAEVGRHSDALAPTEEAVALRRALAADNPAFVPDLASALNNLGNCYAEVGRRRDALAPAEEAVALYRVLAADNPAFVPDLASALANLGSCYAEVGRRRDALAPAEEAVALYRVLAADNPAFVPGLASALNNLGNRYPEVGRRRDALAPAEEAVALRRVLAADNPAFVPDLAMALNNLDIHYAAVGQPTECIDEAWRTAAEAIADPAVRAELLASRSR